MLDLDYYKLTMLQFIWKHFAELPVRWRMHSRRGALETIVEPGVLRLAKDSYLRQASHGLSYDQILWLTQQGFESAFIGDLDRLFRGGLANPVIDGANVTVEGTWFSTTLWETVLLAAVAGRYSRKNYQPPAVNEDLFKQFDSLGVRWADFGTRRRYSKLSHAELVRAASKHESFIGTSNVELAMRYELKPVGTYAHELEMVLRNWYADESYATTNVLKRWFDMYPKNFVVLTDTYGTEQFLERHGDYFLNKTAGVENSGFRLDSGDPFKVGALVEKWLKSRGVKRRAVFSNGLDATTIIKLHLEFRHTALQPSFGWGTGFTNPNSRLSLVMKAVESNGPTYKRTDSGDKSIS